MTSKRIIILGLLGCLLVVCGYCWMNRGYGSVTPRTYAFAKAIYSACLAKSDIRLEKAMELLESESALPAKEKKWLKTMIETAQTGNWELARDQAKSMMLEQNRPAS